ncbi:MAG: PAS domain-containing protein [Aquabacterium sp.]
MWARSGFALDIDMLPCGIALIADDGALLALNSTLARMLELDAATDLDGLRVDALLTPSARVIMQMVMLPMLKLRGKAQEICLILRNRSGQDIHVLCHGVRHTDGPTPVNHCVFMPVEQRHKMEEQLVQTWRMTEQVPGVLFQLEIETSGDVRFLHLSDNIVKLTGLPAGSLKQEAPRLLDLLLDTERAHVRQLLQQRLPQGRVHVEELRYRRPGSDKVSWCELRFIPRTTPNGRVQWNGYLCDITHHKSMEEQTAGERPVAGDRHAGCRHRP